MKTIGIICYMNEFGRITIPREFRRALKIDVDKGTPLNIDIIEDENGERCIVIKVYEPREGDET